MSTKNEFDENIISKSKAVSKTEIDMYFDLRRDIEKAERTLVKLSGTGMFIDEFTPAIYRLRGMMSGMDTTMRNFDL